MWSEKKSLFLSKCCCGFFLLVLLICVVFAPGFVSVWLVHIAYGREWLFLLTIYSGAAAAVTLLICLFLLLFRIGKNQIFDFVNIRCLRCISWCCFSGGIICALSAFYYMPWVVIAIAAGFMGLITRVIKNVFDNAVRLQDDAEFTI